MTGTSRIATAPDKRQRPDRGPRAVEADVDLENFILISHAVPAARVQAHLPDKLSLETFEGEDGRETCFVTTACFCNRRLLEGRFDLWTRLGILQPGEFLSLASVLIEPHIRFTLMPPRPVRL